MKRPGVSSVSFAGGSTGAWRVVDQRTLTGAPLPIVTHLSVGLARPEQVEGLVLSGITSNTRYVERAEKGPLDASSPPLARPEATHAALIPLRKSDAWWALTQDARREIFEAKSHHIADSMRFLPRIARKLYHSRELQEPFDFLTWFEFAPEHAAAFDELLASLRSREEWKYVEHEVELRLVRA